MVNNTILKGKDVTGRYQQVGISGDRLKVDANLEVSDIQIGSVELKDATSNNRAVINSNGELSIIQNPTVNYGINHVDDDGNDANPNYYGFESKNGKWYIMKEDKSSNPSVYVYAVGDSGYSTAWTNRASHSYNSFGDAF